MAVIDGKGKFGLDFSIGQGSYQFVVGVQLIDFKGNIGLIRLKIGQIGIENLLILKWHVC